MKHILYILLFFTSISCVTKQKSLAKEKRKVEVSEFQQVNSVEITETETDLETSILSVSEIADFFSNFKFNYQGENQEDSAEIILSKTDSGIKIKVSGKANSSYSETSTEQTQITELEEKSTYKLSDSKTTELESQNELSVKTKDKSESKQKWKIDTSFWIYACLLIAILFFIYRKFKK